MSQDFLPLNIAVLTASDTRTLEEDTSGQLLSDRLTEEGHQLAAREIVPVSYTHLTLPTMMSV